MTVEYKIGEFAVDYGTSSIGWEHVDSRPANQAERWMNKWAKAGYRLTRFVVHSPTRIYVIMETPRDYSDEEETLG